MPDQDFVVAGERAALGVLRRDHLPQIAVWFESPVLGRLQPD